MTTRRRVSIPSSSSLAANMSNSPIRLKRSGSWTCPGAGKWHAGGYLAGQTPPARGFDQWLGFLNGKEDHFTQLTNDLGDKGARRTKRCCRDCCCSAP